MTNSLKKTVSKKKKRPLQKDTVENAVLQPKVAAENNAGTKEAGDAIQQPVTGNVYWPLISCIMPTANRYNYVFESIRSFSMQDYPNKELIIVFDKISDLPAMEYPPNVTLVQAKSTILGAKRNDACRYAQGTIIAHWDDDDIYNTDRLTYQAMPIITGEADITGLQNFVFYELPTGMGWIPKESLFSEIFVGKVHGGSLVYNRLVWERLSFYPLYSLGEDAAFLRSVVKKRARLKPLRGYDSFVYVRHNSNTWKFEDDNFRKYSGWKPARTPDWAEQQTAHYRQMASVHHQSYGAFANR